MPIVSLFDSNRPAESTEAVLKEWLLDFFPPSLNSGGYIISFQPPAVPQSPTVWLQKIPSANVDMVRARDRGRNVQRKQYVFIVSMLTVDRATSVRMSDVFERHAVLGSGEALAAAGLRYVETTPFEDVIVDTQIQTFRRASVFKFVVEVVRE